MTKQELIKYYAGYRGISKREAKEQIDSLTLVLAKAIEAGEEVSLAGVGKFKLDLSAPKKHLIGFKPSPSLINAANPK